jgi:hypothetical protein
MEVIFDAPANASMAIEVTPSGMIMSPVQLKPLLTTPSVTVKQSLALVGLGASPDSAKAKLMKMLDTKVQNRFMITYSSNCSRTHHGSRNNGYYPTFPVLFASQLVLVVPALVPDTKTVTHLPL